jgi:Rha family phage regulatory protein
MKKQITIKSGVPEWGIFEKNGDAWVSSRTLATTFEKRHDHVLRDIEDVFKHSKSTEPNFGVSESTVPKNELSEITDNFICRNFALSEYKDKSGKKNKEYIMNRKGFALIAMGFTGEKALEFKKQYIESFEMMFSLIQTRILSKSGYGKMTDAIKDVYTDADPFRYAKEIDMINKAILGMTAKQFREVNQVDDTGNTRDNIVAEVLERLNDAQIFNANLIRAGRTFEERKTMVGQVFVKAPF